MAVYQCSGVANCGRLISASAIPGGNPEARRDPEGYAVEWTRCQRCGALTCDRCLARQQGCCRCGTPARLLTEAERIAFATGGNPVPPATPPSTTAPSRGAVPGQPVAVPPLSAFDPPHRLALWVTLAFFAVASADGRVSDEEIKSLAQTLRVSQLPNLVDGVGVPALLELLARGALRELSAEFASLPRLPRARLIALVERFAAADGRVDPREAQLVRDVSAMLGVPSTLG